MYKLTKTVPPKPARKKTWTITGYNENFTTMGPIYRAVRSKMRIPLDTCGWCSHKFEDGESMGLAMVEGKRNQVLCQNCVAEITET